MSHRTLIATAALLALNACTTDNDARQRDTVRVSAPADEPHSGEQPGQDPEKADAFVEVPAWRADDPPEQDPRIGEEVPVTGGHLSMVLVPAGAYHLGAAVIGDEEPADSPRVLRYDLLVATTEVPNAAWWEHHPEQAEQDPAAAFLPWHPSRVERVAELANLLSRAEGLDDCYDASGHMEQRAGELLPIPECNGYRLPTEVEWLIAASDHRAPEDFFPAEDCVEQFDTLGICYRCGCSDGPRPVGFSHANRLGLRDMLGNAGELVHTGAAEQVLERGGDFTTGGQQLADPRFYREPAPGSPTTGVRLVRALL